MIDPNNRAFFLAHKLIKEGKNVFVTGKAGTGKTTFLKYLKANNFGKKIAIAAPTGIAARNAGGTTLNSLFWIDLSVYTPNDKRLRTHRIASDPDQTTIYSHFHYTDAKKKLIESIDILVIDEISMVRCDMIDVIDKLMRTFGGGDDNRPFGGKQIVFIGDPFQLPPVVKPDVANILHPHYESSYFFSSLAFQEADFVKIELQKIYRQGGDLKFINLLNRVRNNSLEKDDLTMLNQNAVVEDFDFADEDYTYIGTKNSVVNRVNQNKLRELPSLQYEYDAIISGKFKDEPTDKKLKLKEGAKIMFVKNNIAEAYVNGTLGVVVGVSPTSIKVKTDETIIDVQRVTWYDMEYEWDDENQKIKETIKGSFTQYPLKLAWAITVHKSQGLTFKKVYADLGGSWLHGQVYVGLSRCVALDGLKLKSKLRTSNVITDFRVKEFANTFADYELLKKQEDKIESKQKLQDALALVSKNKIVEAIKVYESARSQYPNWNYHIFPKFIQKHLDKLVSENQTATKRVDNLTKDVAFLEKETQTYRNTIIQSKQERDALQYELELLGERIEISREIIDKKRTTIENLLNRKWWQVIFQ